MTTASLTPPTSEPVAIQAGDTLAWTKTLTDFPASAGWVLAYKLLPKAGTVIAISSSASGDSHAVAVTAATTANWAAGAYTWVASVAHADGRRYTVGQGRVSIQPNLAAATAAYDARSPAQIALDDLRTALLSWLKTQGVVDEYTINGRTMRFASAAEIKRRIALAESEVARERAALQPGGRPRQARVLVRFG